jgi:hypothetical protein
VVPAAAFAAIVLTAGALRRRGVTPADRAASPRERFPSRESHSTPGVVTYVHDMSRPTPFSATAHSSTVYVG